MACISKIFCRFRLFFFGSILGVPKVVLNDKDAFNLFNAYRSRAWKIRGVDDPLRSLYVSGNRICMLIGMTGTITEDLSLLILEN